jgi:uncharacterized protein DUF4339
MARERWFYAPTQTRQGPMVRTQLIEALLRLPNPRSCLVWRRGLPAWMAAGEVAEIDRLITPFAPPRTGSFGRVDPAAASQAAAEAGARARESGAHPRPGGASRAARTAVASARPSSLIYAGTGAGIVALGVIVWFAWPRAPQPRATDANAPGVITLKSPTPDSPSPEDEAPAKASRDVAAAPTRSLPGASAGAPVVAAWSDREQVLPSTEVAKIRAVAAWSRRTLTLTIYNGSAWRVTELGVLPSRLKDDAFVPDKAPLVLRPISDVDRGVDDLLSKVAPERLKSGVNPLDTGKFECQAGDRPEAFRAPIESARGYPPR